MRLSQHKPELWNCPQPQYMTSFNLRQQVLVVVQRTFFVARIDSGFLQLFRTSFDAHLTWSTADGCGVIERSQVSAHNPAISEST